MSNSSLSILHARTREVTRDQLARVEPPPATATWFPTRHFEVLATAENHLNNAGFSISKSKYALSRDDNRMFATLDLSSNLGEGVTLAVGVRNSTDKSFPLGFTAGNRVFVCDNLAFCSDILVKRKHTLYGRRRFEEAIAAAMLRLTQFRDHEQRRITRLQEMPMPTLEADSIILHAFEEGVISTRELPAVIKEWREPTFPEFKDRTPWSLVNAFTTAIGPRAKSNPQVYADQTMKLNGLIDRRLGLSRFTLAS